MSELDVLICTLEKRREMFQSLCGFFVSQLDEFKGRVSILWEIDNGEESVGTKRQRLLHRAKSDYIVFVDDDDNVALDYLSRILGALQERPDCVGMQGLITIDGAPPALFEHSLRHTHWFEEGGVYYRCPNHLNPVKRELALRAGFKDMSFGEDRDYSERLLPLLKTEVFLDGPIYFYDYRSKK